MLEKLKEILKNQTGKTFEIDEKTILVSDLGLNSFDLVQLACMIEDEFEIVIPDKEIKDLKTVGDVIALLEKQ